MSLLLRKWAWRKRSPSPRPSPAGEGDARTVSRNFHDLWCGIASWGLTSAATVSLSALLHVVAVHDVLIAQIQFPVGNDRMGPDSSLGIANLRLRIEFEPAVRFPTFRSRFSEHHRSAVFLQTVQHAVRAAERPFPERLFLAPHLLARLEILAQPTHAIRVAIKIITNEHDTAVVILHLLVLIDIGNLIVRAEFDQLASCPIASGHVHTAVVENRRWNDCDPPWKGRLPQDRAVLRRNSDDVLHGELNVFSRSVVLSDDNGSVVRRVGKFLRLPDEFARHFVERGHRALATARSANDLIAVHEHGLTVTPTGRLA